MRPKPDWHDDCAAFHHAQIQLTSRVGRSQSIRRGMNDLLPDALGWASSMMLLATLIAQVVRQWRAPSVEGVSWVLFAGQIAASVGFVSYSLLIRNNVFIVTNSLILATAIAGQIIYLRKRRRAGRSSS
jgi:MtN3 and saliva related transmembrane protein